MGIVFVAENKVVQSALASIVLVAALLVHANMLPFQLKTHNDLETASLSVCWITQAGAFLYDVSGTDSVVITVVLMAANVVFALVAL